MNSVNLIGRLVKDSEVLYVGSGNNKTAKMTFTIAVDDGFGENKKSYFFNCELWGKRADSLFEYMVKGIQVAISGKLVSGNYDNKEGKKVYFTVVNCSDISFLSKPKDSNNDDNIEGNRGNNENNKRQRQR